MNLYREDEMTDKPQTTRKYAIFLNNIMMSKPHLHRDTCVIEAYEAHLCVKHSADFAGRDEVVFANGVEIREIEHVEA